MSQTVLWVSLRLFFFFSCSFLQDSSHGTDSHNRYGRLFYMDGFSEATWIQTHNLRVIRPLDWNQTIWMSRRGETKGSTEHLLLFTFSTMTLSKQKKKPSTSDVQREKSAASTAYFYHVAPAQEALWRAFSGEWTIFCCEVQYTNQRATGGILCRRDWVGTTKPEKYQRRWCSNCK